MIRIGTLLLIAATIGLAAGAAAAQRRGPPAWIGSAPPPLEAAGCYFYRGRQYCGRYCYVEVNGKRYCQRFERDAVPQGAVEIFEPGLK